MTDDRDVLLSVRPRFARALLDGTKTVEVRRRGLRLVEGATCLVYASTPTRALVGALVVAGVEHGSPQCLWERHGGQTALTRDEYNQYLVGRPTASVLLVECAMTLRRPVPLDELRRRSPSFRAPQSYRFMANGELAALLSGEAPELAGLTPRVPIAA